ncbi:MAG: NADH-quinone oxidoreductase subunit C [Chloroflexi bacterium]|nr:NADH-quinone oxidoreductase subunit C [Chloroflexota bacterium]
MATDRGQGGAGEVRQPQAERAAGHGGPQAPAQPLDAMGQATLALLQRSLGPYVVESGGSFDQPVVQVRPKDIVEVCRICKEREALDFNLLHCLSVVDYEEHLQVVYHLYSLRLKHKAVLKVDVPSDDPTVPTVTPIWRGADWYEREGHDLFGVVFEGHPNLAPLLLYEGFEGYPGRKSFPFHDYQEW